MATLWKDSLQAKLIQVVGEKKGKALGSQYLPALPVSYQEDTPLAIAVQDIQTLETLTDGKNLEVDLYYDGSTLHVRLYQLNQPIALSDILPILENLDLRTLDEHPYKISANNRLYWISDFRVTNNKNKKLDIKRVKNLFRNAFICIQANECENDGFNKLVLDAELDWRDVSVLRAYAKYLHQTGFRFNQAQIEKTLSTNVDIARDLIFIFLTKFNPEQKSREKNLETLDQKIQSSLEAVLSLDDDRILRRLWDVIKATARTNFFQKNNEGKNKSYLSFKLDSHQVPELPLPQPLYEIFVYSPRFEGIHLRAAKVARGGIRWSDRQDFRTEILGLMKAQKVKNAVIVPSGAKGGFLLKSISVDRDALKKEVIACYQSFIRGLLDLTDNYSPQGKIIRPKDVVCYDDEDPYLVVAADKGTATFSDIANAISKEYHFWLGDAFASGGSAGYDHKKMGITARGAWESIKRHFRELNIRAADAEITVVGIGDMSGDVFGNGALYSKKMKLVAAFDHRNIFIDPNPEPLTAYKERLRLFNLPASSWEDYNAKLISKGGGVFKRSSKSISLSPEIKKILAITDNSLTPNELIKAILKAPVDLLFNGGIGTYVKASVETHTDVGDKANEFCRVNGNELRCKVVGEGGNLGFTQLGRIEYALQGGLIYTDFVDNSAGVDCSDHEVNIKIILNKEMSAGNLSEKKRNEFLFSMTDEVAALVLNDNYNQAFIMSYAALMNDKDMLFYETYIRDLETHHEIDRAVEYLPSDKYFQDRKAEGVGLTRPELAVLMSYTKIHIKNEILKSKLPENPYFTSAIYTAFPEMMRKKYQKQMQAHPLRRDIIATQLSNQVVNEMGLQFVHRLQSETNAKLSDVIRAQVVASKVFRGNELQKLVEALDFKVPVKMQYEFLQYVRRLLTLATRWFLRSGRLKGNLENIIEHYRKNIDKLVDVVPTLMTGSTKTYLDDVTKRFQETGLEQNSALRLAASRALYTTLNIVEAATDNQFEIKQTAKMYFHVGTHFKLVWFRDHIATDRREGHWNTLARLSLRDELDLLQKRLTVSILDTQPKMEPELAIRHWAALHKHAVRRWQKIITQLQTSTEIDYSMLFIALREFADLLATEAKAVPA